MPLIFTAKPIIDWPSARVGALGKRRFFTSRGKTFRRPPRPICPTDPRDPGGLPRRRRDHGYVPGERSFSRLAAFFRHENLPGRTIHRDIHDALMGPSRGLSLKSIVARKHRTVLWSTSAGTDIRVGDVPQEDQPRGEKIPRRPGRPIARRGAAHSTAAQKRTTTTALRKPPRKPRIPGSRLRRAHGRP